MNNLCKQNETRPKIRYKTDIWTSKRRREQARRIRAQKPWLRATGPRTLAGKVRVRYNALKHGARAKVWRDLRHVLKRQRQFLKEYRLIHCPPRPGKLKLTPRITGQGAPRGEFDLPPSPSLYSLS